MRWFFLLQILILCGCSSTTVFRTHPMGARVFIDGKLVGRTPYEYTDRYTIFSKVSVKIEKEGFGVKTFNLRRDQWAIGNILASPILLPLLWVKEYKPEYFFEL